MAISAPVSRTVDPRELEARTQAIGHELLTAAKRHHGHLSVLNRWTQQVLSWCLADRVLKGTVLRFIDVLPSLRSPRAVARHVAEYFPTADLRLPAALRVGSQLARSGLLTAPALSAVVTQLVEQVSRQFIAGASSDAVREAIRRLTAQRAVCSLDVLGEQVLSEPEADRYAAQYQGVLNEVTAASTACPLPDDVPVCGPRINLSVKPSALSPRFDPIHPAASVARATDRLLPVLHTAHAKHALINLDMEQYELRDLTLELAKHLLVHPRVGDRVALGVVLQAYLRDTDTVVEELLTWLAAHERPLTVRLVKGAYWDYEMAIAAQRHWPAPVYGQKGQTDQAFERLSQRLLGVHPLVTTAIASHNVRSIARAMALGELLGLAKHQLEFQLLYGMGDALHAAITERDYPVRIYTPIGDLIPGMAYLVRRILENTANESFLRQDFLGERSPDELLRPPETSEQAPAPPARVWVGEPLMDGSNAGERQQMAEALADVRGRFGRTYPSLLADEAIEHGEPLIIKNPADPQDILGRVFIANPADANHAVTLAKAAQPEWARRPIRDRAACLRRAAELLRARRYELAAWMVFEVGKTWREADADVVEAIEFLTYYAHQIEAIDDGRSLIQVPGERNTLRSVPRGVAAVIAPWNFPCAILTGMTSAALVSGHAVVVKPAEQSPIMGYWITRLLREAGVPSAIIQCLPGWGPEVGAALVRHPQVQLVLFTGSKMVGLSILKTCSQVPTGQRFLKQVVAEMGGKNAIIIDEDADLDAAVAGTVRSAFSYGGQKCSAASRLIVHEAVADRVLERLGAAAESLRVGDPADPETDIGPLIEEGAQHRLREAIACAGEVGTTVYTYAPERVPRNGYFVGPAIAVGVPPQHPIARDELFGPLLCVFRVRSMADALALANDTEFALTGGLYSRSPRQIERAVREFDVGNLYINRPITGAMVGRQPFGGHRLSGMGTKAGGPDYVRHLMLPKTICENTARHGMPLE